MGSGGAGPWLPSCPRFCVGHCGACRGQRGRMGMGPGTDRVRVRSPRLRPGQLHKQVTASALLASFRANSDRCHIP
jgi:hypothetical protein